MPPSESTKSANVPGQGGLSALAARGRYCCDCGPPARLSHEALGRHSGDTVVWRQFLALLTRARVEVCELATPTEHMNGRGRVLSDLTRGQQVVDGVRTEVCGQQNS